MRFPPGGRSPADGAGGVSAVVAATAGAASPVVAGGRVFVTSARGAIKPASTGIFGNDYVAELKKQWRDLFSEEPPAFNRRYLESRLAYRIDQTRVESNAPKKGDPHPKDSRLTAWKVMWTRDHNDFATIQADYIGFAQGDSTTPIVSGVGVTQQEAIDTHISFESSIGGTPAAPINGATFDGAGKFTGFPHSAATKAAGTVNLRAYLAPTLGFSGIVYVKNFQTVQTVVDQIGRTSKSGMFAGLQLVVVSAGDDEVPGAGAGAIEHGDCLLGVLLGLVDGAQCSIVPGLGAAGLGDAAAQNAAV